jgi:hypothetical protein
MGGCCVMRRFVLIALALVLVLTVSSAASQRKSTVDRNVRAASASGAKLERKLERKAHAAKKAFRKAFRQYRATNGITAESVGDLCAIGVIPGPSGGFNIRLGLFNVTSPSVAYGILDPFHALGGQSLLIESVFSPAAPLGGTVDVL